MRAPQSQRRREPERPPEAPPALIVICRVGSSRRLRDGIAVAIIGPPNAGKSSLLNRIARREAAITSPVAGTTRDIVEVAIDLHGYPVLLADTAGLRDSDDPVEQEGLRRALKRAEAAELRLFVFDARHPAEARGAAAWPGPDTLLVANKVDLLTADPDFPMEPPRPPAGGEGGVRGACSSAGRLRDRLPGGAFAVSALTGAGLDPLLAALAARIAQTYRQRSPAPDPRPPPPGARRRRGIIAPRARRHSPRTARRRPPPRPAQPRPNHRRRRRRRPARRDLPRLLPRQVTATMVS